MNSTSAWRILVVAATVALVSVSVSPAVPAESQGGESVRVVVYLIEASNEKPGVDPQIRDIVQELRGTFRYSTYRLVSRIPKKMSVGGEEKISLPGSRELKLYALGREDNRVKLKVKVLEKSSKKAGREVLSTEFRIVEGGTIIIGGYDYRDGKLIVAISADS